MIARPLTTATMLAALLAAAPTVAEEMRAKAVVELFTSQGCSSCPPADELLTELAQRGDIVALGYHVDYWDYIGWPDTFGAEANSKRQRAYASRWGSSRIYTPQIVVNGEKGVVGSKRHDVTLALAQAGLALPIALAVEDGVLSISIEGQAGLDEAMIWLVTYLDAAEIAIERGENEGKSLLYSHVVTGRQALGVWEPGAGAQIRMPLAEILADHSDGVAVLVQQEHNGLPGAILGAAIYEQ
ncbi:DUF1223 domain-containing protein [Devosia nitrariae]|uniref:DUF1223 domain-containing protein n=1 Tax=Devosia nitrariae TaxID=2071872 RepID=A0ABQ5W3U0_9HYPH|nr:DUF1223 domain-containing protein [Devosia nitrariae]GLQ54464.1 hypothetical protein GCM10010862_17230 [Devosia nitrariae]